MLGDPYQEKKKNFHFEGPDFAHLHSIGEAFLHHEIEGVHMMPHQLLQGLDQKEQYRADHRTERADQRCVKSCLPDSDRTLICSSLILP